MATRMQQRRGTDSQWTTANPVLGPGEIGFDTTNNRFKIGDGVNAWADLNYFVDETSISGSLSDYVEVSVLGQPLGVATLDSNGDVPLSQLGNVPVTDLTGYATENYVNNAIDAIPEVDLTGYATETYVSNAISAIPPVDISGKADLSGATFTGDVNVETNLVVDGNLTVNGTSFSASSTSIVIEDNLVQLAHQNPANTTDLGIVVGYNDGTAQHAGIVRDVSENRWKLFKGVETEPTTTVNFAEGSLDDISVADISATSATIGNVSNTEIQYLDGVTSAIQTQLNGKAATSHTHAISDVTGLQTALDGKQTAQVSQAVSTNITAVSNAKYFVNTSAARTITLPASPALGDEIQIFDASGTAGTNNITVNNNGNKINGVTDTALLDANGVAAVFVWTGTTYGWRMG